MYIKQFCLAFILLVSGMTQVLSEPYIPTDANEVLENLPAANQSKKIKKLRAALKNNPQNIDLALLLAKQYMELSRQDFDPRYLSYIETALKPWWDSKDPIKEVLMTRAYVNQAMHNFDAAIIDLNKVLAKDLRNANALMMRASILTLKGEYKDAKEDCLSASKLIAPITELTCLASIDSLNGNANGAFNNLKRNYNKLAKREAASLQELSQRLWALTILADIANRLAKFDEAESYYQKAIKLKPEYAYLYMAYADQLIEQGRYQAVLNLLKDRVDGNDNFLLRLAIAEKRLNKASYLAHTKKLKENFDLARVFGNDYHQREEAMIALYLSDEPAKALEHAKENWRLQREPIDARILLEAALQLKDLKTAKSVQAYLKEKKLEDYKLKRLQIELDGAV